MISRSSAHDFPFPGIFTGATNRKRLSLKLKRTKSENTRLSLSTFYRSIRSTGYHISCIKKKFSAFGNLKKKTPSFTIFVRQAKKAFFPGLWRKWTKCHVYYYYYYTKSTLVRGRPKIKLPIFILSPPI